MEIDAPLLPDAHELNHAYTYLRSPRRPIPFLAEGMAEAIGLRIRGADRRPRSPTTTGGRRSPRSARTGSTAWAACSCVT